MHHGPVAQLDVGGAFLGGGVGGLHGGLDFLLRGGILGRGAEGQEQQGTGGGQGQAGKESAHDNYWSVCERAPLSLHATFNFLKANA